MKLIKPSFLIKEQEPELIGIYRQIEYAGRICYKSSNKITPDSAKPFVDRMIKSGHGAVLEHGTVFLKVTCKDTDFVTLSVFYGHNKYSKITHSKDNKTYYITTNYRVLVENNHLRDLKYLCEPTEFHERRITVRFILPIGISREFCRHRVFSFAEMSTRYCNFSKDKFGNELIFVKPTWISDVEVEYIDNYLQGNDYELSLGAIEFINSIVQSERSYINLIAEGAKPQEAREVLPLSLKTELVMTGFISDWQHFFELRCDSAAHPQARELAIPLKEEFIKKGYIIE